MAGECTGQVMEYEEELVHSTWTIAQNTIVYMAKKVEDNVMHVMTTPVIVEQSVLLQKPTDNPLCASLKVPNALAIK